MYWMGIQVPHKRGNYEGESGDPLESIGTLYRELCKNGWTDRDAVWDMDPGGPKEPCIRWVSRSSHEKAQFLGKGHVRACPTTLPWAVQKWLNWSRCRLGCGLGWAQASMCYMRCTLAQPGEYRWTVRLRRWSFCQITLTYCFSYSFCFQ